MELKPKRQYSLLEFYQFSYKQARTAKFMQRAKKSKELSPQFIERIMLFVTEVNGCPLCSYVHSKKALEHGVDNEEILKMLTGVTDDVPQEEVAAVMFAQHYAETRGYPSTEAWQRIVEIYGLSKAKGILGAIDNIMLGNSIGIPLSLLRYRLKGKPEKESSLLYEASMLIGAIILLPISLIHALISDLLRVPVIRGLESKKQSL